MIHPRKHPDIEMQHRIALNVLGLTANKDPGCQCAGCGQVRADLSELGSLLETWSDELFAPQDAAGIEAKAERARPSTTGRCQRSHRPGRWLLAAIAAGMMAAALGLIIWMSSLDPIDSSADRWRSEAGSGPEIDGRRVGDLVRIEWPPNSVANWYRVSVLESSGRLIARRDLEEPCECQIAVPLAQPEPAGPIYFLVEAFDGDWNRVWARGGRLTADDP